MEENNEESAQSSPPAAKKSSSNSAATIGLILACLGVAAYAAWGTSSQPSAPATSAAPTPAPVADSVNAPPAGGPGGVVQEVLQVASYTYLRLKASDGSEIWAAVSKADVKKGAQVQLAGASLMVDFHSKELDRTFPQIYFGSLAGAPAAGEELPPGHPPMEGAGQAPDVEKGAASSAVAVSESKKAEGQNGYTVAELFDKRQELDGKIVRVRGTVVKLTNNVMGTNFLHVQDATGSSSAGNNDLTLKVAQNPPPVGTEALFEGTLRKDVDLGAGYTFAALIEEGRVVPE